MLLSAELKRCVTWFINSLDLLLVRYNCGKFHNCKTRVTDFREGVPFSPPPDLWAAQKRSIWTGLRSAFSMWVSLTTFAKHLTLDVWHGFEYVSAPRGQKKKISFISPVIWWSKYLSKRSCYWKQWFPFKRNFSLEFSLETLIIILCDFTVYRA